MSWYQELPTVNAFFNALSAVLLVRGYRMVRAGRIEGHRLSMQTAFASSVLFLVGYLVYHSLVGVVHYRNAGFVRSVYLAILLTHTLLAIAVAPMAVVTIVRGWRGRFERHRALARWTLPIWLYVNITGVVIYLMLYWF